MGSSSEEHMRLVALGVGQGDASLTYSGIEKKLTDEEEIAYVYRGSGFEGEYVIQLIVFTNIRIMTSCNIAFDARVTSYPWSSVSSWTMNPSGRTMSFTCTGVDHSIKLEQILNYPNLYGFPDLSAAERSFIKFAIGKRRA